MLSFILSFADGGGFNPFSFAQGAGVWTFIAFGLAFWPMWKFVFGPITKALEARDQRVEDAIAAAETARREAEEQTAATKAELERARTEARTMVAEATDRAERQGREALAKAKEEADRQLLTARQEIQAEKQKALVEIRKEVVDLAVGAAGKILEREVDDAAHQRMVGEFLQSQGAGS